MIDGRPAAPAQVLVKFRVPMTAALATQLTQAEDAARFRPVGGAGWYLLRSSDLGTVQLLTDMEANPSVAEVQPDWRVTLASVPPDDPRFPQEWWLQNTGQDGGTPGDDIKAVPAWAITTGSRSIVVADLDTGADLTHPDLAANLWTAAQQFQLDLDGTMVSCPAGAHGFNDPSGLAIADCVPQDTESHGTATAGMIGAVGDNEIGVTGVNYVTTLMILRAFLGSSTNTSNLIDCIEFAVRAKASLGVNVRVINGSFSEGSDNQALYDEISEAGSYNIAYVAAAANYCHDEDNDPQYPAAWDTELPNIIGVAATDPNDGLAHFDSTSEPCSGWGPNSIAIAAPGLDGYTTMLGGGYGGFQGTSMAAPVVSGAAALVLSACPLATPGSVVQTLENGADYDPSLNTLIEGARRLNVYNSIEDCTTGSAGSGKVYIERTDGYAADTGSITVSVGRWQMPIGGASYTGRDTAARLAAELAASINGSPDFTASASGGTVTITSRATGAALDYEFAASLFSNTCPNGPGSCRCDPNVPPSCSGKFDQPAFHVGQSGRNFTGGAN